LSKAANLEYVCGFAYRVDSASDRDGLTHHWGQRSPSL